MLDPSLPLAAAPAGSYGIWPLFAESFDVFTVVLLVGSFAAAAYIYLCVADIRASRIAPGRVLTRLGELIASRNESGIRRELEGDESFPAVVVGAALEALPRGADQAREAAELAAAEQYARWSRRLEPLNVIGALGPLVGLAGTVWGMILAFATLGAAGGEAGPADLSLGISKALFHTLLGLLLAVPCLAVAGLYRPIVDRLCARAMADSTSLVERLIATFGREE